MKLDAKSYIALGSILVLAIFSIALVSNYSNYLPATVVVSPTPLTLTGKIKASKLKQGTNTLEFEGKTKLGKTVGAVVNFYVGSPSPYPYCTCTNPSIGIESGTSYCADQGVCISPTPPNGSYCGCWANPAADCACTHGETRSDGKKQFMCPCYVCPPGIDDEPCYESGYSSNEPCECSSPKVLNSTWGVVYCPNQGVCNDKLQWDDYPKCTCSNPQHPKRGPGYCSGQGMCNP